MKCMDLSGIWKVSTPDGLVVKNISLPGSSCEACIGHKQEYYTEYSKENVRAPRERYEYVGTLIYERSIILPLDYENCELSIFLERVNFASKLYVDGVLYGRGVIGLSTPHVYKLTGRRFPDGTDYPRLSAGVHHIRLEIDNSNCLNLGDMASGYSVDTQGYWNGVIGRMELQAKPVNNIERIAVFYEKDGLRIDSVLHTDRQLPMKPSTATLTYECLYKGKVLATSSEDIELFSTRQRNHGYLKVSFEKEKFWSEYNPDLFTMRVTLKAEDSIDVFTETFGVRTIAVINKEFTVNDKPISLRGTINCAQYPLTGYPPMDVKTWKEHFVKYQSYGLNHVRFHAWCPPEAAFVAADELGIYLSVEMPLWLNHDVTPYEFGEDEWHTTYFREEALRISETYGNHPSFTFFSNGNENMGDFAMLETIIAQMKAVDNRRLYTMTSNFDHPLSPYEDYQCAFEICHKRVRNQTRQDLVAEGTFTDYSDVCETSTVPFTSFEVGQYCVYPDVDLADSYTGNMLPVNYELIRSMMKEKGVYNRLKEYVEASGVLANRLYKEDVEAVLRTKKMGGFQLLSLVDYTGQSTATVGVVDIFHNDKGFTSSEEWSHFCNENVPLFKAKRIFTNKDILEADISLYNFSSERVATAEYELIISENGETLYKQSFVGKCEDNHVSVPLDFVKHNSKLDVMVKCIVSQKEYSNSWRIFVYCEFDNDDQYIVTTKEALDEAVAKGRYVIATKDAFDYEYNGSSFVPVFWSPAYFSAKRPCGAMIKSEHRALKSFPGDRFLDYQWKTLVDASSNVELSLLNNPVPVVEMVPNFVDNTARTPLCEFEYKNVRIMFCGFDLSLEDVTTKALRHSLTEYAKSFVS